VLSLDFSKVDVAKAAPVIVFVSFLAGLIVVGTAFFLRWDKFDRHTMVYLRDYRIRLARLQVKDDLLKGGAGVVAAAKSNIAEGQTLHAEVNKALEALRTSFKPDDFFAGMRKLKVHIGTDDPLVSPLVSPLESPLVSPLDSPVLPPGSSPFRLPASSGFGQKLSPSTDSTTSLSNSNHGGGAPASSVAFFGVPADPSRLPVLPTGGRAPRGSVAFIPAPTSPSSLPQSPKGRIRVGSSFFGIPDGMTASQAIMALLSQRSQKSSSSSTKLDASISGKSRKLEGLRLHKDVHGFNEEALQVLTADFGNAVLGSQASKQADSFGKGKRVITMREMSNIVLEEVTSLLF